MTSAFTQIFSFFFLLANMSSIYLGNVQQIFLNSKREAESLYRGKYQSKLYSQELPRQIIQLQNKGYKEIRCGEGKQHCVIR